MKMKKQASGRQKSRKRSSRLRQHRQSVLLICLILVALTGVLAVSYIRLQAKNAQYKAQEEELETQIKEEEQRAKDVEEFEEYVKTDDYIKETAEEKLGLVDPNEIVFKPAE